MDEKKAPLWAMYRETVIGRRKENTGEMVLLLAFFLFCIKYTFDYSGILSSNEWVDTILVVLVIALSLLKIIFQQYTPARLFVMVVVTIIVSVSCLRGGNFLFLIGFLFILAMQNVKLDKIIRLSFWFKSVSIVVHVVWYIVLYNINPSAINFVYRVAGEPRHYFLMGHANMFMAFLVWNCLEYIYLQYHKLKAFHIAVIWMINLTFYMFADSNTGMVILAVATVLIALDKLGKGTFDKTLTVLAKYSSPVIAGIFSFLVIVYTRLGQAPKAAWLALDAFMTGRMWFGAYVYDVYGVTIMGRRLLVPDKIFWDGRWAEGFAFFDNYYLGNLLRFGIIHLVLTAVVFMMVGGKLENREKIILIAFSFFGIMEAYATNVYMCFALLIIGKYLYKGEERRSKHMPKTV